MGLHYSCINDNRKEPKQSINSMEIAHYVNPLKSMVSNINDSDEIWNMLLSQKFFWDTGDYANKLFAIKICQNDAHYVKENYKYIKNKGMLDSFLTLSATFCIDVEITQFLCSKRSLINRYSTENICLIFALTFNPSLKMIRYLIEIIGGDINVQLYDSRYYDSFKFFKGYGTCFDVLFSNQHNNNFVEKAKYLLENTNIIIGLKPQHISKFKQILPLIKNHLVLNRLITAGLNIYPLSEMKSVIQILNPFMVKKEIRDLLGISLFDTTYDIFCNNINETTSEMLLQEIKFEDHLMIDKSTGSNEFIDIDQIKSEILFKCNGIDYLGDRKIVYRVMYPLKDIIDIADFTETIVLDKTLPDYVMKMYIESCYTNRFNINDIKPADIIQFIEFIDQYPTNLLKISNFETDIVKYFVMHKIPSPKSMRYLCDKYQLKLMYLLIKK